MDTHDAGRLLAQASIFDRSSSVTRIGEDGNISVTPIEMWLAAVRNMKSPKQLGLERRDEISSIDTLGELALLKLKLQIPPRYFTDMLSCLKANGRHGHTLRMPQIH
jgi:hypothetical protein